MINIKEQIKKRNEWIWDNRKTRRKILAKECGLSEARVKEILYDIRKEKKQEIKRT